MDVKEYCQEKIDSISNFDSIDFDKTGEEMLKDLLFRRGLIYAFKDIIRFINHKDKQ